MQTTASTAQLSKVSLQELWVVGPLASGRHAPCEDGAPTAGVRVCVCDQTPGCPRGNSAAHFCNRHCKKRSSKRGHFFEKVAEQGLSGHCRADHEPPRVAKVGDKPEQRTVFMGTPIRATHCPSKPEGKSVIFCSIEPWMLSACMMACMHALC